ncbi:MAG: hypothetical protein Q9160_003890 [Pyrenula sp. 1 TL-2023]
MAEIAGTAVGVIPLGIQVCQAIVSYYHDFRDQDEKIRSILQDLAVLTNGLELVQTCIAKDCFLQVNGTVQAEESIITYATAIARLNQLLAKCHQTTKSTVKERILELGQKATFPFVKAQYKILGMWSKICNPTESNAYLPEDTSEILERLKLTSTIVNRVQSDLTDLKAQAGNIDSSLPEFTNGTKDVARVLGEELPSIWQDSRQIANEFITMNRSILTLSQQVDAVSTGLDQNFSALKEGIQPMPVMLEDTFLTTLDVYFKRQAASQCRSEEVSDDAAAFKLLHSKIDEWRGFYKRDPKRKSITQELCGLFEQGKAFPSDIDSRGETLLHIACGSVSYICESQGDAFSESRELILSLRQWGAGLNDMNNCRDQPLDLLTDAGVLNCHNEHVMTLSLDLYHGGMDFSECWLSTRSEESQTRWDQYTRHTFLYLSRNYFVNEIADSTILDLIRNTFTNKSQTCRILDEIPDSLYERNLVGHTPMHLSANWPTGISLLLQAGAKYLAHEPDNVGFLPLAYASYSKCEEAVKLLLDADSPLHVDIVPFLEKMGGWPELLDRSSNILWDAIESSSEDIVRSIVEALADRRRRLALIASRELSYADIERFGLLSDRLLDFNAAKVYDCLRQKKVALPHSLFVPADWDTIYHLLLRKPYFGLRPLEKPTEWAGMFWNAGFRDIDVHDEDGSGIFTDAVGSPYAPSYLREKLIIVQETLEVYLWLLERGAKLLYKTFRSSNDGGYVLHTPATFYVGRRMASLLPPYSANTLKSSTKFNLQRLLTHITNEGMTDDCNCACSLGGCNVITIMLEEVLRDDLGFNGILWPESSLEGWLIDFLDSSIGCSDIIQASIIQFLTFTRLELTHTCCKWQGHEANYFATFDEDDRIEIHEEETEDLRKLSALTLEFWLAYIGMRIPLLQFLQEYWLPRMTYVMNSETTIAQNEARESCELGIAWEPRKQGTSRIFVVPKPAPYTYESIVRSPSNIQSITRRRKSV